MGTYRNPREYLGGVSFEGEVLPHIAPMLVGRDANVAAYGAASRGSRNVADNPA